MRLVHIASKAEVKPGETVTNHHGETFTVMSIEKPRHSGSTGRLYVKSIKEGWQHGYFPSVFDCQWVDRND